MAENVAASDSAAGESGNASTGSEVVRSRESQTMDESEQVKTIRPDSQTGGAERTGRDVVEQEHAGTSSGRRDVDESIPSCLLDCRDAVEACSHRAQAWADAQNEKAEQKQRQRREKADGGVRVEEDGTVVEPKGDSFVQRKGIVFLVFVILTWVYIVYVWRICANGIRQAQDATATRDEAIALTVVFNVIWLWTMWSYVKVILTGPGYVHDECGIVEAPKSPKMDASQFPQHLNGATQQNDVSTSAPMHAPTPFAPYPATATATTIEATQATTGESQDNGSTSVLSAALPVATSVDSKLAAALGPIGVSMLARADEAEAVQQAELRAVTPSSSMPLQQQQQPPQQQPVLPSSNLPEPLRLPQTTFPLHEINTYCYRCKRVKPPRSHHCRHCGTCVLKMDHHCPWVGGCVGARNHKFFYNFLQSVTVLEIFVLTSNAIMFHRGIARRPRWSIDGYMISLFPIASAFCLFTFTLLVTHTYLFVMNLSTIEHMSYDRQKVRENILIERWSEERARLDEKPAPGFFGQMRERDAMKRKWAAYWGKPKSEANLWWLDGRRSARLMGNGGEIVGDPSFTPRFAEGERTDDVLRPLSWYHGIATNWRQAMGDSPAGWLLPVGRGLNADGTKYAANWRFGPLGEWTPREQWTSRLEKSQA